MTIDHLLLVGANYKTAPQDFREQLSTASIDLQTAMAVLATCNRVEFYIWDCRGDATATLFAHLRHTLGWQQVALSERLYIRGGFAAAHHLMRVSGGLDSLIPGEDQILGQVRAAGEELQCREATAAGMQELKELFRQAVIVGRRIRAGPRFGQHSSVAEAGVRWLASQRAGGLQGATVAVVGAGKMARAAITTLAADGVSQLIVLNRRLESATEIATGLGPGIKTEVCGLDQLIPVLGQADLVVSATRSPRPVISKEQVLTARREQADRQLLLLDLAVPRDIEPDVRTVPGVTIVDLDDLSTALAGQSSAERAAVARAEALAQQAAAAYAQWLRVRAAAPQIVALRSRGAMLMQAAQARLRRQLPGLRPEQYAVIEQALRRLTNQLLHQPTVALRQAAAAGQLHEVEQFFNLTALTDPMIGELAHGKEEQYVVPD